MQRGELATDPDVDAAAERLIELSRLPLEQQKAHVREWPELGWDGIAVARAWLAARADEWQGDERMAKIIAAADDYILALRQIVYAGEADVRKAAWARVNNMGGQWYAVRDPLSIPLADAPAEAGRG